MNPESDKAEKVEPPAESGAVSQSPPAGAPAAPARFRFPSFGFLWLCVSVLAGSLFLAWGLREPELDRVGRILQDLEAGKTGAQTPSTLRTLVRALERHPGLGPALLDGRPAALISLHRDGWIETEKAILLADPMARSDPRVDLTWTGDTKEVRRIAFVGRDGSESVAVPGDTLVLFPLSAALRAGGFIEVRDEKGGAPAGLADGFRIVVEGATASGAQETDEER
jgi:hypothetical protein